MEKDGKRLVTIVLIISVLGMCVSQMAKAGAAGDPAQSAPDKNLVFPVIELPIPQSEIEKSYMGISGTGNFKVGQIKAKVLIIEVFNFYCPHCQRAAPQVNEVYQSIQGQPDLREKIKLIGIGIGNTPYEVNAFREKYHIPFPLFPDQSMSISKRLGAEATPTFIGVKMNDKGAQEQFYFKAGGFQDASQFLTEIVKMSGIEWEERK